MRKVLFIIAPHPPTHNVCIIHIHIMVCLPGCDCDPHLRCEMETGACICPPGATGPRCDQCADRYILTPDGCQRKSVQECRHENFQQISLFSGNFVPHSVEIQNALRHFLSIFTHYQETSWRFILMPENVEWLWRFVTMIFSVHVIKLKYSPCTNINSHCLTTSHHLGFYEKKIRVHICVLFWFCHNCIFLS